VFVWLYTREQDFIHNANDGVGDCKERMVL
jgi:hypothetical protein